MSMNFMDTRLALKVSLRGLEAWRMYRAGAQSVLVFDMFPPSEYLRDMHHDTVQTVLTACHTVDAFHIIGDVRAFIDQAITDADREKEFYFQRSRFERISFLRRLYGQHELNDDVRALANFGSFLVDVGDLREENHSEAYVIALAGVWFTMCDAALTVEGTAL